MLTMSAFLPSPPLPWCKTYAVTSAYHRYPSTCTLTDGISRRTALSLAAAVLAIQLSPTKLQARPVPTGSLSTSLVPVVRVRDALSQLSDDISSSTNGDIRRVMRIVLKGNDLVGATRAAGLWLPRSAAEEGTRHAREAYEYLDQVVDYFDATATRQKPQSQQLRFCLMAIDAAARELDSVLALFDPETIAQARAALITAVG